MFMRGGTRLISGSKAIRTPVNPLLGSTHQYAECSSKSYSVKPSHLPIAPIRGESFPLIRKLDLWYVDKTRGLAEIMKKKGGKFTVFRPDNFGKSLAISTLDSLFRAEKAYVTGLHAGM